MNVYNINILEGCKSNIIQILKTLALVASLSLFLYGCNDSQSSENTDVIEMNNIIPISESTKQHLRKIKNYNIIFAHHSVGKNILDGLHDIATEANIKINFVSIQYKMSKDKQYFADFYPGKNEQPKTKVDDFVSKIEEISSEYKPDIAFMKFCYIDILQDTNVEAVFAHYQKNILMLKKKKPDITFIHFTAPLRSGADINNVKRGRFNELLTKTFESARVFDLAKIESTRLDGSREEFLYNGKRYYSMSPEYTTDAGHLNKFGRRIVATEMINFLGKMINDKHKTSK